MYRVEIISNKSVEEEITQALEEYVPDILYTKFPLVYGRGGDDRKLGSTTWPEKNFALVSYIENGDLYKVKAVMEGVKKRYSGEGIKMFAIKAEDI